MDLVDERICYGRRIGQAGAHSCQLDLGIQGANDLTTGAADCHLPGVTTPLATGTVALRTIPVGPPSIVQ